MFKRGLPLLGALIVVITLAGCGGGGGGPTNYTLTITVDPNGTGTVTTEPSGTSFTSGTVVTLTPLATTGYVFQSWGGTNGGEVDVANKIVMNGNKSVTAVFTKMPVNITVTISPEGSGTVTQALATLGKSTWDYGDSIRLTPNPAEGWIFSHWVEGGNTYTDNPWVINVTSDRNITAYFIKIPVNINVTISPEGSGTVTQALATLGKGTWDYGDSVKLTPNPAADWIFSHWVEGGNTYTDNPWVISVTSDRNITAYFEPTGTITGVVRQSEGGHAIQGASVSFNGKSTTTSSDGSFSLTAPTGAADLLVTKAGFGQTRIQSIVLAQAQTIGGVNPILLKAGSPDLTVQAPTISIPDLVQTVSGIITWEVNMSGVNAIRAVNVRLDNDDIYPLAQVEDSSSVLFGLDTTLLRDGQHVATFRATDINNDLAEFSVSVTVDNGVADPNIPDAPLLSYVGAITFDTDLGAWSAKSRSLRKLPGRAGDGAYIEVGKGRRVSIKSVPANCTMFTYLEWNSAFGAAAYRIYRASSASGPWTKIGEAFINSFYDTNPRMTAGDTYHYRVTAVNGEGSESSPSTAYSVIPLDRLSVALTSPLDNAQAVGLTPTLAWSRSGAASADGVDYGLVVLGLTDDFCSWEVYLTDDLSIVYNNDDSAVPLVRSKTYQWDIVEAHAYKAYSSDGVACAESLALNGSNNGAFTFTTIE